jgi:hypothetical protein
MLKAWIENRWPNFAHEGQSRLKIHNLAEKMRVFFVVIFDELLVRGFRSVHHGLLCVLESSLGLKLNRTDGERLIRNHTDVTNNNAKAGKKNVKAKIKMDALQCKQRTLTVKVTSCARGPN